ncbi:MAG: imidazolonepropionase-like amidohydrolase, partial [Paracoccaceae bacterium]
MTAPLESRTSVDLLVTGIGELATPKGASALAGRALGLVEISSGVAIACSGDRIVEIGPEEDLRRRFTASQELDAAGGLVIP